MHSDHKIRWIDYMLHLIKPADPLWTECAKMLSVQYDAAYNEGKKEIEGHDQTGN